jgi:hypothetical protein
MLVMLKRHEVEILLRAGHRKTEVARLTGVSLCSVKRSAQEGPVVHVNDAAERTSGRSAGPVWLRISENRLSRFFGKNRTWLRRKFCHEFGRQAIGEARRRYMRSWPVRPKQVKTADSVRRFDLRTRCCQCSVPCCQ